MGRELTFEEAWGVITHRLGPVRAAVLLERCRAQPGDFHVIAWLDGKDEQRSFLKAEEAGEYALALKEKGYTVIVIPGVRAEPEQWEKPSPWGRIIPYNAGF